VKKIGSFTRNIQQLTENIEIWETRLNVDIDKSFYGPSAWAAAIILYKLDGALCERAKAVYLTVAPAIFAADISISSFMAEAAAWVVARVMTDVYQSDVPPDYWRVVAAVGEWLQSAVLDKSVSAEICSLAWEWLQRVVTLRNAAKAA